ncbi:MAG: hypothetical protein NTU49_07385 [Gammaproteobacteria bacterium]|nr:hypothetical protein [Gammaproteobacteria bacterium]
MQSVTVFQPYFTKDQCQSIDSLFTPFDNIKNPHPKLYEFFLLQSIFNQLDQLQSDYVGLFSLKFSKKSLLEAKDVMSHIQNNPGYDVYLFNPYPQEDFMFYNIWDHGEFSHPGIKKITQFALDKTNSGIKISGLNRPLGKSLFCNFWVGSKAFWHRYFNFLQPIAEFMIKNPEVYFIDTIYGGFDPAVFFPFIVERLFSMFLMTHEDIRFCSYEYKPKMLDQLCIHRFELELYKKLSPIAVKFDAEYGAIWPESVQNFFSEKRSLFNEALNTLYVCKKIRF